MVLLCALICIFSCGSMGWSCVYRACLLSQGNFWAETLCPVCGSRDFLPLCCHSPLPHCCVLLSFLPFLSSEVLSRTVSYQRLSTSRLSACTTFWWITRGCTSHWATYQHTVPGPWIPANWNHDGVMLIAEIPIWCYNLQAMLQGRGEEWLILLGQGKCVSKNQLRVTTIFYGHPARIRASSSTPWMDNSEFITSFCQYLS